MFRAFCVFSRKFLPNPKSYKFSLVFSSRNFTVLGTFRSVIHLKFFLFVFFNELSEVMFSVWMSGWFSIISWPVFPHLIQLKVCLKSVEHMWVHLFLDSLFDPLIYMSALYQYQTPLLLLYFCHLKTRWGKFSSLVLLNNSRGFSGFFVFTSEFENQLIISYQKKKKPTGNLFGIYRSICGELKSFFFLFLEFQS